VGIIGAGAIATYLLEEQKHHAYDIKSVLVRDKEKYASLTSEYGVTLYDDLHAFLQSPIDIVIEAATVEVVRNDLATILKEKDAIIISIGALVEDAFLEEVTAIAEEYERHLYLPSGAIGGLDLVRNVMTTHTVETVTLTTRKPAHTLIENPIENEVVVFDGSAREAIAAYPKNMNVSIALSIAGLGFDATKVRLIADPNIDQNIHVIDVLGDFGEATFQVKNNALPTNPHTSYLAAVSMIGALDGQEQRIHVG